MDMYSQLFYQNNQMILLQQMQLQQQANLFSPPSQLYSQGEKEQKSGRNKRAYVQWDLKKRESLVQRVEKEGLTIKEAAKGLDINYSTAKHIIKVYRQTGEIETKIMMKRKTRDTKKVESYCDNNKEFKLQEVESEIQKLPRLHYPPEHIQCQLPIDVNMLNESFVPQAIENYEKVHIQNFLFWKRNKE